jgi:hypothetical protein
MSITSEGGIMKTNCWPLVGAFSLIACAGAAQAEGTQIIECSGYSERCVIPVYATANGNVDCKVRMDFTQIHVKASQIGVPIRVIWLLLKGLRGDNSVYRFEPSTGVKLTTNSSMDFTNPGQDVDEESGNASPRRFRWVSVHTNPNPQLQPYDFVVQRKKSGGAWQTCASIDPRIINN